MPLAGALGLARQLMQVNGLERIRAATAVDGWEWLLIAAGGLAVGLVVAAVMARRHESSLRELLRILPLCVALLRDLLRDPAVPRRSKVVAGLTVAYLASPIDLIPDFVPVLGYLDDALVVAWALRHVVASAGPERVAAHWRGDPQALERLLRLLRVR